MADFSSGVQPVIEQAPRPIIAPPDDSTANNISALGSVLGTIGGTLVQGAAIAQQTQLEQKQDSSLMNFKQNILRKGDLVDQGILKPDQALRGVRLDYSRMIANHPGMQDQIDKAYKEVMGQSGLGKNIVDDVQAQKDQQRQQAMQQWTSASQAGFILPNMSPDEQALAIEKHQQFLFGQTQMGQADKLLNHKKAEVELANAQLQTTSIRQGIANASITYQRNQLGLADEVAKNQFRAGAQNVSDAYFTKFQNDVNTLQKQVGTQVPDPAHPGKTMTYTASMASQDIDNQLAAIQQTTSKLAVAYDSQGTLEALMNPMKMLAQTAKDNVQGKLDKTALDNQLSNVQTMRQLQLINSNDDLLTLSSTSKLMPNAANSLQDVIGHKFTDIMKQNGLMPGDTNASSKTTKPGDPTSNGDPNHDKDLRSYFGIVKAGMSNIQSGVADKSVKADTDQHIQSILAGVGKYGPTATDASELKDVVNFFSSTQFGNYVKQNPALIQGQNASLAKNVYEQDYQRVVLPLIQNEFLDANVAIDYRTTVNGRGVKISDPTMAPSSSAIHPEFNGSGVTFVANNPTAGQTNREAQRLNREVAPIMNQLIRTNAHFEGSTDYKKSYDNIMNQLGPEMNATRSDQGGSGGGGGAPQEPTANPKQASADVPSSGAPDYEHMSHADLLNMRAKLKPDDPRQNVLAQYEHQAFAREWVKDNPAVATSSLLAGIPLYTAGKETGLVKSRSKPSLDEMAAAYRGIGQGLGFVD